MVRLGKFLRSRWGGVLLLALCGFLGVLAGVLLVSAQSALPLLFHAAGYTGAFVVHENIASAMLVLGASSMGCAIISSFLLEYFIERPFVLATFAAGLPLPFFLVIFIVFRGGYFASIATVLLCICLLLTVVLPIMLLKREMRSGLVTRLAAGAYLLPCAAGIALHVAYPVFTAWTDVRSFPGKSGFESRAEWTEEFFARHPYVKDAYRWTLKDQDAPDKAPLPVAFAAGRLHTVAVDWMDGPKFSATFEYRDGTTRELCRGVPNECLYATGKSAVSP